MEPRTRIRWITGQASILIFHGPYALGFLQMGRAVYGPGFVESPLAVFFLLQPQPQPPRVPLCTVPVVVAMDATAAPPTSTQHNGDGGSYGVLLYYKYAEVPDAPALAAFYEARCRALALVGRVRVGPDGVNATVSISAL
jgi:hypothetical protein